MTIKNISGRELLLTGAVLLVYFLLFLGGRALNVPDEGRYSEVAREMLLSGNFVTPKLNGVVFLDKPPLYYWLEGLSLAAFGISEWSIRLMPALFGGLGCLLALFAGRTLYGARAGYLSALVLATSPLYFLSSQYADMNLEVAVLISATLLLFLMAVGLPDGDRRRRRTLWLAYGCAALATLAKGLIGIVFPAAIIGIWIVLRWDWRLLARMHIASGLLIFAAIVLPWFLLVQRENPEFLNYFFVYQHFTRFTGASFNNPLPVWFYLPVVLFGLFPWSFLLIQSIWRAAPGSWAMVKAKPVDLYLLIWVAVVLVFFSIPRSKIVGYILPLVPPLAILVGARLDTLLAKISKPSNTQRTFYLYSAIAIALGAGLLIAGGFVPKKFAFPGVHAYLAVTGAGLLVSAALVFLFARRQWVTAAIAGIAATGAVVSVALLLAVGQASHHSIKPLAQEVRARLQADDVVVAYHGYYQDLPVYLDLKRPVVVVADFSGTAAASHDNWRRDLLTGMEHHPETREWMVDEDWLERNINGSARMYIFGPPAELAALRQRHELYLLVERNGIAVFTNRPLSTERP